MHSFVRATLFAVACSLLVAIPARAGVVLSGPSQVRPGDSFELLLSLTDAWPMFAGAVVDYVDVTAPSLSTTGTLSLADVTPAGLFAGADADVSPSGPAGLFVSFLSSRDGFGPGDLLVYHFAVLPGAPVGFTTVEITVTPGMIDSLPVSDPAGLTARATVQVVPEPSAWLLLVVGCLVLILVRSVPKSLR